MLYNPKWEQKTETKADPLTLPAFIDWLKTQPPEEEYDYYNCRGACLIDQCVGHNTSSQEYSKIPHAFRMIAAGHPRTFGGALKRARAA